MKKILMSLMAIAIALMVSGCSVDGSMKGGTIAKEDLNKIMTCDRNTSSGVETMQYNTSTMTNVRRGFGNAEIWTADITTLDGQLMHIKESDGWNCTKGN